MYRAAIGAILIFSSVLYAMELMVGLSVWLALACYAVFLATYCAFVLVRPAILYQQR